MTDLIITIDKSKADPNGGIPIKDKREVVRCRDCRHFTAGNREYATCDWCDWWSSDTEPDGFCAWGERGEA